MRKKAAGILIRCTDEEAAKVRDASKSERRTISGYILNAVLSRIEAREKLRQGQKTAMEPGSSSRSQTAGS